MLNQHFHKKNISFKDKILALDFYLIFLVLILGIISFFAMYSTEQGNINYYTKSHFYRFFIFFLLFIAIAFFDIKFWYRSAYIFYLIIVLIGQSALI